MRMAPATLAAGPVICGLCNEPFTTTPHRQQRAQQQQEALLDDNVDRTFIDRRRDDLDQSRALHPSAGLSAPRRERRPNEADGLRILALTAESPEGIASLAAAGAWYHAWHTGLEEPIVGNDAIDVAACNHVARALLKLDHTLTRATVIPAGRQWMIGDRVVIGRHAVEQFDADGELILRPACPASSPLPIRAAAAWSSTSPSTAPTASPTTRSPQPRLTTATQYSPPTTAHRRSTFVCWTSRQRRAKGGGRSSNDEVGYTCGGGVAIRRARLAGAALPSHHSHRMLLPEHRLLVSWKAPANGVRPSRGDGLAHAGKSVVAALAESEHRHQDRRTEPAGRARRRPRPWWRGRTSVAHRAARPPATGPTGSHRIRRLAPLLRTSR